MRRAVVLIVVMLVISMSYLRGQIPHTVSYQGVLTDANGNAVPDGDLSLTFRLFDVVSGGTALWEETQQVAVSKGVFSAILGSATPLNLPFDKPYWVGITVAQGTELTPRVALTASPYSLNSHSTIAETVPGQGFTIRNLTGDATHQFNSDGSVRHNGTGTFLGGIVAGDTNVVLGKTAESHSNAKTSNEETNGNLAVNNPDIGVEGVGNSIGVLGKGSGIGMRGESKDGIGVHGISETFYGVLGDSKSEAGVYGSSSSASGVEGHSASGAGVVGSGNPGLWARNSPLKIDVVQQSPAQQRFLVWDDDNTVKYRTLPPGGTFDGILQDKALVIRNGQTEVFRVDTNGTSYHKGLEQFAGGIAITGTGNGIFFPDGSFQGSAGTSGGSFDGTLLGKPLIVKNAGGTEVFRVDTNGTSLHKGDETFEGDVILKGQSGKGAKLVDATGKTLAGFGRIDSATNQRLGVYGKAEKTGDLAGAFDGDVDINGEVYASSLHIVRGVGDTVMHFNADGTSEHGGLETFKAGLQTVLTNGNILRINPSEGLTLKTATGQFRGHMDPNGNAFFFGNVSKGGGSFKIDHPLDPANKYLYHSFVESPDMMNIYNGNVTTDENGEAIVELPGWFDALNKDFRYQLTPIGSYAPLYVAQKIRGSRFMIAGGTGGMEVSWQVTGIRKDAYAEKYRIPVEESKPVAERGRYLHPEAFVLPKDMGVSIVPGLQQYSQDNTEIRSED